VFAVATQFVVGVIHGLEGRADGRDVVRVAPFLWVANATLGHIETLLKVIDADIAVAMGAIGGGHISSW
jgi:hypothetical protein